MTNIETLLIIVCRFFGGINYKNNNNTVSLNRLISKTVLSYNNYCSKMTLIFSMVLLLLLILLSSTLVTNTSISNTANAAKQYSPFISTINNHTANPLIIRNTNAYTTTVSTRSTNKLTKAAATTFSKHPSAREFQSLTGHLSSTIAKSKKENNNKGIFLTNHHSNYLLLNTNDHQSPSKSKSIKSPPFKSVVHKAVNFNVKKIKDCIYQTLVYSRMHIVIHSTSFIHYFRICIQEKMLRLISICLQAR